MIALVMLVMLITLVTMLIAILVGFLVFVFLEVPLFRVIPVMRLVILAIAHTLLVVLIF